MDAATLEAEKPCERAQRPRQILDSIAAVHEHANDSSPTSTHLHTLASSGASERTQRSPSSETDDSGSQSSPLLELPLELFEKILRIIRHGKVKEEQERYSELAATRNFRALALTCKPLHRIVLPYLYNTVQITPHHWFDRLTSTHRLARTLCGNTHLGLLIRHIRTRPAKMKLYASRDAHTDAVRSQRLAGYAEDGLLFRTILEPIIGGEKYDDLADVTRDTHGIPEFLVVLLLAPRARSVMIETFDEGSQCMEAGLGRILRTIWSRSSLQLGTLGAYDALREIVYDGIDHVYGDDPHVRLRALRDTPTAGGSVEVLSGLLELPALRSITGVGIQVDGDLEDERDPEYSPVWPVQKSSSNVRGLSLQRSYLATNKLANIVKACTTLETLRYDIASKRTATNKIWPYAVSFHPEVLGEALKQHETTLQDLSITNLADDGIVWKDTRVFGCLTKCKVLRSLEVDANLLSGAGNPLTLDDFAESLPSSLRSLVLHTYSDLEDLGPLLFRCMNLKAQGLETLEVTFPIHRSAGDLGGPLNVNAASMFHSKEPKTSRGRKLLCVKSFGRFRGPKRISFKCWDLPAWEPAEFQELARRICVNGVEKLVTDQRYMNDVDDQMFLGEDLLAMLENDADARDTGESCGT